MIFSFFLSPQISIEKIELFYKYSELSKSTGNFDNGIKQFGQGYSIEYTFQNRKRINNGIRFYGEKNGVLFQ